MSLYIRILPGVKLRLRKRRGKVRTRVGIGSRWLRFWSGDGGRGVSTGAGPVSVYEPLGRKRRRRR